MARTSGVIRQQICDAYLFRKEGDFSTNLEQISRPLFRAQQPCETFSASDININDTESIIANNITSYCHTFISFLNYRWQASIKLLLLTN